MELRDRGDVARDDLARRRLLLAPHRGDLVQPLLGDRAAVHEVGVGLDRALEHLEEVHPTDVGIHDRLEHERGGRAVADLRRRSLLGHEVREPVDADEPRRAAAEHGEHARLGNALRQRELELVDVDGLVAEVALHEVVVGDDDALDERVVHRVLLVGHGRRHFAHAARAGGAVVRDRFVREEVDHSLEVGFLADRQLERRDAGAELGLEVVERARERRPFAVELVHEDRAGKVGGFGHAPRELGLDLHALDGRHHEDREVGRVQRGGDVAHEVGVAGRVDEVDLVALPVEGREGERHRDLALVLLGVEVTHGVVVLDPTHTGNRTGDEEQCFGERGLAGAPVADQGHVANLLRGHSHIHPPPGELVSPILWSGEARAPGGSPGTVEVPRPPAGGPLRTCSTDAGAPRPNAALDPIGRSLHRLGISANGLTILGLVIAAATAVAIGSGHLTLAFFGVVLTGVPDLLDGSVARYSGKAGPRGAFFDSVSDRVSDGLLFGGVAWYLADQGKYLPVLVLAVLALSMLITYERARAESLGFSARGGLMERAERMVLLAVALLFDILVPMMWIMLVLTAFTAVHRFVKVWRQATKAANAPSPPGRPGAAVNPIGDARSTDERRRSRPRRLSRVPGRR